MTGSTQTLTLNGTGAGGDWRRAAAALPPGGRLTIGVIARNGMPFLRPCLDALPPPEMFGGRLEIILVDSASTDGTTGAMTDFAFARGDTRVYRLEGQVNAAVARNTVLAHAHPGYLMLLDGDMVVEPDFLATAIGLIEAGAAAAVVGALKEQRFDADNNPEGDVIWRHPPEGPMRVSLTGGAILLGPWVLEPGLRYDEKQKICEDWDFALRLSGRHRILRIPVCMALHLTHYYFSPQRQMSYYRDLRPSAVGQLLRKHLAHPARLAAVLNRERGIVAGGLLQGLALLAGATGWHSLAVLALTGLAADSGRAWWRGKLPEWAGTRLAGPWILLYGLLTPGPALLRYAVRRIA